MMLGATVVCLMTRVVALALHAKKVVGGEL